MKGGHVLDPTEHGHLGLRQHREHLLGVEVGDFLLGHHEDHTATPRMRSPPNAHGTGAVPCSRPGRRRALLAPWTAENRLQIAFRADHPTPAKLAREMSDRSTGRGDEVICQS
jgi:hypothetical protein